MHVFSLADDKLLAITQDDRPGIQVAAPVEVSARDPGNRGSPGRPRLAKRLTYQVASLRTLRASNGITPFVVTNMRSMLRSRSSSIISFQSAPACFKP